ncbi:DUF465 domain-containing protein [Novosphingobium album (ex Liu et al. 2023)]|uniref:DUF465 domain-containing protein n=1 Tax=Novosphingobium album (ex Liu et al. 2023) TaxID=3031130 RepID=A0ABT5WMK2_9SPHN|nr:DUF465 domain-containing protein [Novosphingobium album (ex Liu et al. 2023)]MDE8650921.1 DUF465 domain-containing protein [Novosphingobium album (ex Liu et al. 2023)]
MTDRVFRLLERYQKLDTLLRLAQSKRFADPFEISTLRKRKRWIGQRLTDLVRPARMRPLGR